MARQKREMKWNIPFCLAATLFCLTVISVFLVSDLYARYTAFGSGEDSARVAKFEINVAGDVLTDYLPQQISPGTYENEIQVTNNSEVAVKCIVQVINTTGNLPLQFRIKDISGSEGTVALEKELSMGESTSFTLTTIWAQENAIDYIGMVDLVQIVVTTEQMD